MSSTASGLLCFIWHEVGEVTLQREAPSFLRDFPSDFECDLRLRLPSRKEDLPGPQSSSSSSSSHHQQGPLPIFLCRHVASSRPKDSSTPALLLPSQGDGTCPSPPPHPVALVKSSLQKAVRRGLVRQAVAACAYLLAHDPKELLRRLPVILPEDVGVFADTTKLAWLMMAAMAGYKLKEDDLRFVLSLVAHAASHPDRALPPPNAGGKEVQGTLSRCFLLGGSDDDDGNILLDTEQPDISVRQGLLLRACYGGMTGDIEMLLALAARPASWSSKVVAKMDYLSEAFKHKSLVEDFLSAARQAGCVGRVWGAAMPEEARLDAAVDFHCSDIVPQVMSQLRQGGHPSMSMVTEDSLKQAIWTYRSGVNWREERRKEDLPAPPVWWDAHLQSLLAAASKAAWTPKIGVPPGTAQGGPAAKRQKKVGSAPARQLSILRFAAPTTTKGGA